MNLLTKIKVWLVISVGIGLLSACASDTVEPVVAVDPGPPPVAFVPGTDIPVSATTSIAGMLSFASATGSNSDNTTEPLVAGEAILATSEIDEPDPSV
jgi:hypothetical protein